VRGDAVILSSITFSDSTLRRRDAGPAAAVVGEEAARDHLGDR
jgi:hypothetical protein